VVLGDEVDITITVEAKAPPKDAPPKADDKKPAPAPEKKPGK